MRVAWGPESAESPGGSAQTGARPCALHCCGAKGGPVAASPCLHDLRCLNASGPVQRLWAPREADRRHLGGPDQCLEAGRGVACHPSHGYDSALQMEMGLEAQLEASFQGCEAGSSGCGWG